MKKIGFIDYYLDEWHANHYPAWIDEYCQKTGLDYRLAFAWAERDTPPAGGRTSAAWCEAFGAAACPDPETLCKMSDAVLLLAPSNPERHLALAQKTFRYARGKRIYVDKTFAPDYETAVRIIEEAKQYEVSIFSTSALRYAVERLPELPDSVATFGGGSSYEEYIIHQIEMTVKLMGQGASALRVTENGGVLVTDIRYRDGREASMTFGAGIPFRVEAKKNGAVTELPMQPDYFRRLIGQILEFFERGEAGFPPEETPEAMRLRGTAVLAKQTPGIWREI